MVPLVSENDLEMNVDFVGDLSFTPLMRASYEGDYDTAAQLLKHGAKVNALSLNGCTALMWVSNSKLAELLLKHEGDSNITDRFGQTALMHAAIWTKCQEEKLQVAALLIKHGADLNAVDINGRSALIIASIRRRTNIVRLLLSHKANPDHQDLFGVGALMKSGNLAICKLLLEHHANLNLRDKQGNTVFDYMAKRPQILKMLEQYANKDSIS